MCYILGAINAFFVSLALASSITDRKSWTSNQDKDLNGLKEHGVNIKLFQDTPTLPPQRPRVKKRKYLPVQYTVPVFVLLELNGYIVVSCCI